MYAGLSRAVFEIKKLSNFRDSKQKLLCITRCIEHCLTGISLGTGDVSPGADALVPVLVYFKISFYFFRFSFLYKAILLTYFPILLIVTHFGNEAMLLYLRSLINLNLIFLTIIPSTEVLRTI